MLHACSVTSRICILDDDAAFLRDVSRELQTAHDVVVVDSSQRFWEVFAPRAFELVVLDMRLDSGREGLDVLREIHRADPFQPVVVATAFADTETYLEALQAGALLYVDKACHSPAGLALLFDAVIQQGALRREQAAAIRALDQSEPLDLIGGSEAIKRLRRDLDRLGNAPAVPIVVSGEPGSGRELFARNLHARWRRERQPLCVLPSTPLPKGDLVRLLIGADAGPMRRRGLLEEAHQSGLVVRGADRLPPEVPKLIFQAWADRQFRPEGAPVPQPFEATVFFLCENSGPFRTGLLPRHSWEAVDVPPLRDRKDDIPMLASHFFEGMRRRGRELSTCLDAEAGRALLAHRWPGNIAELRATLEFAAIRAAASGGRDISLRHLPGEVGSTVDNVNGVDERRWDLDFHEAQAQLALVELAIEELATTNKTRLALHLHVATPTTLSRRVERSLEKYPDLGAAFPRATEAFGR